MIWALCEHPWLSATYNLTLVSLLLSLWRPPCPLPQACPSSPEPDKDSRTCHGLQLSPLTTALHSRAWLPSPVTPYLCMPSTRDTPCPVLGSFPIQFTSTSMFLPTLSCVSTSRQQVWTQWGLAWSLKYSGLVPDGQVLHLQSPSPPTSSRGCWGLAVLWACPRQGLSSWKSQYAQCLLGQRPEAPRTPGNTRPRPELYPTQHSAHWKLRNGVFILSSSSKLLVSSSQLQLLF